MVEIAEKKSEVQQAEVVEPKLPEYLDPFNAVLHDADSKSLDVSDEQKMLLSAILSVACSDSRFAQKAYDAILHVLTVGVVTDPKEEEPKQTYSKPSTKK